LLPSTRGAEQDTVSAPHAFGGFAVPKTIIAVAAIAAALAAPARAQDQGVELGVLDCAIGGGTGFIFGSSKDLSCTFSPADKSFAREAYFGAVNKYACPGNFRGIGHKTNLLLPNKLS